MKSFVALVVCTLVACVSEPRDVVQARATHDFNCPEDKIIVRKIGGQSYRAWGCGTYGTYNCVASGLGSDQVTCVREEQVQTQTPQPPPAH